MLCFYDFQSIQERRSVWFKLRVLLKRKSSGFSLALVSNGNYLRFLPFYSYAKSLIEDTIRRNASPVRLDSQEDASGMPSPGNGVMIGNMIQQPAASVQQAVNLGQSPSMLYQQGVVASKFRSNFGAGGGGGIGSGPQHSYSTDDASVGEYKYTVNVGQRSIKITGDNFELIRTAKLVLDDYFSSAEFLQSIGESDDYNHPYHHGGIMMAHDAFVGQPPNSAVLRVDSGIALDKKSPGKVVAASDDVDFDNNDEDSVKKRAIRKSVQDKSVEVVYDDDEVFIVDEDGKEIPIGSSDVAKSESGASLARSKKSNNLRFHNLDGNESESLAFMP